MSSRTLGQHVPNREAADDRVTGARFQIEALKTTLKTQGSPLPHAESCVSAAIDQMLQAITATLDGFNSMLPDPVPSQRISRKNLRDQFHAAGAESAVLQSLDNAAHPGDGWLWYLEQKRDGAALGRLLTNTGSNDSPAYAVVKDPLNSSAGNEDGDPVTYLNHALDQVLQILGTVAEKAGDDVVTYREALRKQASRLI